MFLTHLLFFFHEADEIEMKPRVYISGKPTSHLLSYYDHERLEVFIFISSQFNCLKDTVNHFERYYSNLYG